MAEAPRLGRVVRVLSSKYDGSLHNDFTGRLIEDGDGRSRGGALRLFVPAGTAVRSYRGEYPTQVAFTALFWPGLDRWCNVYHNHQPAGRRGFVSYSNVSTPAQFDGETVRWADLDLDIVVTPREVILDDEDEFATHRERFGYPEEVVRRATEAASKLLALAVRRAPPFDRESHIWEVD